VLATTMAARLKRTMSTLIARLLLYGKQAHIRFGRDLGTQLRAAGSGPADLRGRADRAYAKPAA
jgi:hypothetical protein